MALPSASFCSIMHPATWSVLMTPSLPWRWSKVCIILFLCCYFVELTSPEIPSISGCTIRRGHACAMASILWQISDNYFISQMTIPIIQGGSRTWSTLSVSTGFGLKVDFLLNALAPSVLRNRPVAAASTFSTLSPTLHCRSRCFRSTSKCMAICATITPSITVSSTSLSSTGVQQSFSFALLAMQEHSGITTSIFRLFRC